MYSFAMTIEDHIAKLRENALRLDCAKMELIQVRASEPVTFRGKGFVAQDEGGRLSFEIFEAEFENTDVYSQLNASLRSKSGQIFPPEDYYELTTTIVDGTVWRASGILPECNWPSHSYPNITGTMNSIRTTEPQSGGNLYHLSVRIFENLDLPIWPNRDGVVFSFDAANCRFEISKTVNEVLVEVSSEHPLPDNLALRIQETTMFFTAKPAILRAIGEAGPNGRSWELMSASSHNTRGQSYPPLGRPHVEFLDHGWTLFGRYLEFVVGNSTAEYWGHVTYHVHNATEASGSSMHAWAILVSVTVEGLTDLIKMPINDGQATMIKEFKEWIQEKIRKSEKFIGLTSRLVGLIGSMDNPRPKDKLIFLERGGRVTSDYVTAWSKLRNKGVHPKTIDLQNLSDHNFQELLDLIYKVTTLMYEIVFHLIDYVGPYQDYGSHGWPIKNYPHPVREEPTSS
jgi:hypothetical protein